MLIGLLTLPYLLNEIGVGRLGVLMLNWSLIGYFSIFDFGLGRALTYKISALRAEHQSGHIYSVAYFGLLCMLLIGVFSAAIVISCVYIFGISWLNINSDFYQDAYYSIILSGLAIPFTTLTSGMKGVLEGFENFKAVNILKSILGISNFLVPVLAVQFFGPNLVLIVAGLIFARFIVMLMHYLVINRLIVRPIHHQNHIVYGYKELIHFGAWMTVSNIVSPLMSLADRFIISHFDGSASVAYYSVPFDFMFRLLMIPAALTTTLFPFFSKELKLNPQKVRSHFIQSQILIGFGMSLCCSLLAIFSHYGLTLWMGSDFADHSYQIAMIIAFGIVFNSLGQAPLMLIQATGRVKLTSIIHLVEFVFYAPTLILAVKHNGVIGAAVVWVARVMIDCIVLNFYGYKIIKSKNA